MSEEKKEKSNNFLSKIKTIRRRSYASNLLLKVDDIIVALNNQLYTFGDKKLTEELKELKKSREKSILTILRGETFIDLIIEGSLGCKFITTNLEETESIKKKFASKENFDIDQLNSYIAMRDAYRKYDVYEETNSLLAGLFPPLWLAYAEKWWVLGLFAALTATLLIVNPILLVLGWLLTSIYCYKAQQNLLYSFSMLEGKDFTLKLAAKSIDHAQLTIRSLDAKSRFKYTKLENPVEEDEKEKEKEKEVKNKTKEDNSATENIVDEKKEALV